jgi:ADP-ribosylglycohydrolase
MRLVPVPLFFAGRPEEAIERSGDSSRTTHGAQVCVDACRYMGGLIAGAVAGAGRDEILSELYCPVPGYWQAHPLAEEIREIARGSFKRREPPAIKGSGYAVQSLEAALWAFHKGKDFREGALLAVNLGDDADTTGAVYGQIAGAFYGYDGIPQRWREVIAKQGLILRLADGLQEKADLP